MKAARHGSRPVERPLFSPCCGKPTALNGVADQLGGVHWCPCGMPWRMRDLVTAARSA